MKHLTVSGVFGEQHYTIRFRSDQVGEAYAALKRWMDLGAITPDDALFFGNELHAAIVRSIDEDEAAMNASLARQGNVVMHLAGVGCGLMAILATGRPGVALGCVALFYSLQFVPRLGEKVYGYFHRQRDQKGHRAGGQGKPAERPHCPCPAENLRR